MSFLSTKKVLVLCCPLLFLTAAWAADLKEVKESGVLRHLGVPYAKFDTGANDGLCVEIAKMFAAEIGVEYRHVPTTFSKIIPDLTGKVMKVSGGDIQVTSTTAVRGDIIETGFTVLPWRARVLKFAEPNFPTQVWLFVPTSSPLAPIKPSGKIETDILAVKALLKGVTVLGLLETCLDPALYEMDKTGAKVKLFNGSINDMAPAVLKGEAEATLLDAPDALVAMQRWPGKFKVIGPLCEKQTMAAAFAPDAPDMLERYNKFLRKIKQDGRYLALIKKYYPDALFYFPEFFADCK